jgi:rhodanese-related sulfurtransferase
MDNAWAEIGPKELEARLAAGERPVLVDVRTPPEVAAYHIPGIVWIPLNELGERYGELDPEREIVLLCEHGVRSSLACTFLHQNGFPRLGNLTGGMSVWDGPVERGLPGRG